MKITGKQLAFLMQTMKDSLDLPLGADWVFTHKLNARKNFYKGFFDSILITQEEIKVDEIESLDLEKLDGCG